MNVLVFDLETIPDVNAAKRLLGLSEHAEEEAEAALLARRRASHHSEFLPHYLHQIIAISVVVSTPHTFKVCSLGDLASNEGTLVELFFRGIKKYQPTLVSWNGTGFDLPVLHYRALLHGINAAHYWDTGERDHSFKWNNYRSRYHQRHIDLMDILSGYQGRAIASLEDIALFLGLPGKMGVSGKQVAENYKKGHLQGIRQYCETDVLNTYLIYLRFQLMSGQLDSTQYSEEIKRVKESLQIDSQSHWQQFLSAWQSNTAVSTE